MLPELTVVQLFSYAFYKSIRFQGLYRLSSRPRNHMRAPSEPSTQPMELQGGTREAVEGWGAALQRRAAAGMVHCESILVDTGSIDSVSIDSRRGGFWESGTCLPSLLSAWLGLGSWRDA